MFLLTILQFWRDPRPGTTTLVGMKVEAVLVFSNAGCHDLSISCFFPFPLFILRYMVIFYSAEVTIYMALVTVPQLLCHIYELNFT